MDFQQFKKEWADTMVYKPKDFDYENTMHELYIEYKEALNGYGRNMGVKEWCEFFHAECDLDQHPYMIKEKALQTKHGNSLKEMANRFRKSVGLPPIPLPHVMLSLPSDVEIYNHSEDEEHKQKLSSSERVTWRIGAKWMRGEIERLNKRGNGA